MTTVAQRRAWVLTKVMAGEIEVAEAAELLGLSVRSTLIHDPRGGARPARSRPMAGEGSRPWPDAQRSIVPRLSSVGRSPSPGLFHDLRYSVARDCMVPRQEYRTGGGLGAPPLTAANSPVWRKRRPNHG